MKKSELALLGFFFSLFAAIAICNVGEMSTAARVAKARAEMHSIGVALEAYRSENYDYPPDSAYYSWNPSTTGAPPVPLFVLTTPIAYMQSVPADEFPATVGWQMGLSSYDYASRWFWWLNTAGPSKLASHPHRNWALVSNGPDEMGNSGRYMIFGEDVVNTVPEFQAPGCLYDPTNGSISAGDLTEVSTSDLDELKIDLPSSASITLSRITPGSFQMGSPDAERSRSEDEGPVHTVSVERWFYMGSTEVTREQWKAIMGTDLPWSLYGPSYSLACNVSWNDCQRFIQALNDYVTTSGQGPATFRLPSEAEWEYACRAKTQTRFFFGDSLSVDDESADGPAGVLPSYRSIYMWYGSREHLYSEPNQFGLKDTSGNVWEWCQDYYHIDYSQPGRPDDGSAWETQQEGYPYRVIRGGSWVSPASDCRSARRSYAAAEFTTPTLGLRLVRSIPLAPTPTPTPIPPVGVTNLSRDGYTTGQLETGRLPYSDRSYVFESPGTRRLLRHTYIRTRQADKDTTGTTAFLTFNVDQSVVVHVAIDSRMATPPDWLQNWTKEGESLTTTDPGSECRRIYSKHFQKGKVTIGANRQTGMPKGNSMYSVVITPDRTGVADWGAYDRVFAAPAE